MSDQTHSRIVVIELPPLEKNRSGSKKSGRNGCAKRYAEILEPIKPDGVRSDTKPLCLVKMLASHCNRDVVTVLGGTLINFNLAHCRKDGRAHFFVRRDVAD
ncbi:hypothetical protein [Hyphococcus sp. DH-69]|uniref:hypothetical protein n=1 Tax=Hyphococcus formosus TaxID=3143534 RepID=UPI00398AEE5C